MSVVVGYGCGLEGREKERTRTGVPVGVSLEPSTHRRCSFMVTFHQYASYTGDFPQYDGIDSGDGYR